MMRHETVMFQPNNLVNSVKLLPSNVEDNTEPSFN